MWTTRGEKLEATYKQQTFEKEANQVMICFTSSPSGVTQHTMCLHSIVIVHYRGFGAVDGTLHL